MIFHIFQSFHNVSDFSDFAVILNLVCLLDVNALNLNVRISCSAAFFCSRCLDLSSCSSLFPELSLVDGSHVFTAVIWPLFIKLHYMAPYFRQCVIHFFRKTIFWSRISHLWCLAFEHESFVILCHISLSCIALRISTLLPFVLWLKLSWIYSSNMCYYCYRI